MRIIKPYKIAASTQLVSREGRRWLRVSPMYAFSLQVGPKMLPEHRLWESVRTALRPDTRFDPGIPKGRPEVLVTGDAYAPYGEPVERLRVLVRLERDELLLEESIEVTGDRHWIDERRFSRPEPFTRMPLVWQRAFGGDSFLDNSIGRGHLPPLNPDGVTRQELWPLPNLELPTQLINDQGDRPDPIAWDVKPRNWKRLHQNTIQLAPLRMQLHDEMLIGNEFLQLDHLHPDQPTIHWRLPGIRLRAWHQSAGELSEMSTRLDTIWLFPGQLMGVAIFRAEQPVPHEGRFLEAIMFAAEHLNRNRPTYHYQDVLLAQMASDEDDDEALDHADLLPNSEFRRDEVHEARLAARAAHARHETLAQAHIRALRRKKTLESRRNLHRGQYRAFTDKSHHDLSHEPSEGRSALSTSEPPMSPRGALSSSNPPARFASDRSALSTPSPPANTISDRSALSTSSPPADTISDRSALSTSSPPADTISDRSALSSPSPPSDSTSDPSALSSTDPPHATRHPQRILTPEHMLGPKRPAGAPRRPGARDKTSTLRSPSSHPDAIVHTTDTTSYTPGDTLTFGDAPAAESKDGQGPNAGRSSVSVEDDSQRPKLFFLDAPALPAGTELLAFRGREALSEPYAFDVDVLLRDAGTFDMDALVGQRVRLFAERSSGEPPFRWHGIVASIEHVEQQDEVALFHLIVVPSLWQLGQSFHSRIFTDQSIVQIIEAVLKDNGLQPEHDYQLQLSRKYQLREHVCQYRESDLAFISRWMEREGIYYFFEQQEQQERLVLCDGSHPHQLLRETPVRYRPEDEEDGDALHQFRGTSNLLAHHFVAASALTPGISSVNGNSDANGAPSIGAYSIGAPVLGAIRSAAHNSAAGNRPATGMVGMPPSLVPSSPLPLEPEQPPPSTQRIFHGHGRVLHLRPGYLMTVEGHPWSRFNSPYLVTALHHYANQTSGSRNWATLLHLPHTDRYRVELTAIPASTTFRPAQRTAPPRIFGMANATVEGPDDSTQAQIDEHGRYRVHIHFDDAKPGAPHHGSTWVRMMQPNHGPPESQPPLTKGTEVLLTFLGGDPDRPVIAGVASPASDPGG